MHNVNPNTILAPDALLNMFLHGLLSGGGMIAIAAFLALVACAIFFDRSKWIWLTLGIYVVAIGYSTDAYSDNTLAFPLQQIRPFARPIAISMLLLLTVATVKGSRGRRTNLMLGATVAFYLFQLVLSARFIVGSALSRGLMDIVIFSLVFVTLGIGLSCWLQSMDDVYSVLRCIVAAGCLLAVGTAYQLAIHRSAAIQAGRLMGTMNNPNHLGSTLAFMLPIAVFFVPRRDEHPICA